MKRTHAQSQSDLQNSNLGNLTAYAESPDEDQEVMEENPGSLPPVMQQSTPIAAEKMGSSFTTARPREENPLSQTEPTFKTDTKHAAQNDRVMDSAPTSTSKSITVDAPASSAASAMSSGSALQTPSESFKALISAIQNNDLPSIERLVREGAPLINPSENGSYETRDNALIAAIETDSLESLSLLLQHPDIDVEKRDYYYIFEACLEGSDKCLELLVDAGFTAENLDQFPVQTSAVGHYIDNNDEIYSNFFENVFRSGANPNTIHSEFKCSDYEFCKLHHPVCDSYLAERIYIVASFELGGLTLGKPDAMKDAIDSQNFTLLEKQVRHDLRSNEQRAAPEFMQTADDLNRLNMPAVAADLLRFPQLTRPNKAWQVIMPTLNVFPSVFSFSTEKAGDWRNKLLQEGIARPIIDLLEKKLGKNLELLRFIAPPPAPTSSGSDSVAHVHSATPSQIWYCLKSFVDELRQARTLDGMKTSYVAKGLTHQTEYKLILQLATQTAWVANELSTSTQIALKSFDRTVSTLLDICWQLCPSFAEGEALVRLEASLRYAGMLNGIASRVVKAWTEVLDTLKSGTFIPPRLDKETGLLDTEQGERMARLFGQRLLANFHTQPTGLPPYPAFDPLIYTNVLVAQISLIKRFAQGAVEFIRTT